MFDITKFDTRTLSETGIAMPIPHPRTGAPMLDDAGAPVTITLLGPNSEKSKALRRALQQRRTEMAARNVTMTDDDFESERVEFLSAITTGWTFDTMGDQPFEFSPANVRRFWSDGRWQWVATAAWAFAQQDGNYLPSS